MDISAVRIEADQEKYMSVSLPAGYSYESDAILNAVVHKFNKSNTKTSSTQLV